MDEEAKDAPSSFRELILRLSAIPGVSRLSATAILAETGRDMSRFPTAGHLVAWPGCASARTRGRQAEIRAPAPRC
jgi:transposase